MMDRNVRIARELVRIAKTLSGGMADHRMAGEDGAHDSRLDEAEKAGKKYVLMKEHGGTMWRVQACKDFATGDYEVKKGDVGGMVGGEHNLSQDGKCWIGHDAAVLGNARVMDDAWITDEATVYGNARVYGKAMIDGHSKVYDNARVYGKAYVRDSEVYDNARVHGGAVVLDDSEVHGNAAVYENAEVKLSELYGNAKVHGKAALYDHAHVNYEVSEGEVSVANSHLDDDDDHPVISGICEELLSGYYGTVEADPLWLDHDRIRHTFMKIAEGWEDDDIWMLLKDRMMRKAFIKAVREGYFRAFVEENKTSLTFHEYGDDVLDAYGDKWGDWDF